MEGELNPDSEEEVEGELNPDSKEDVEWELNPDPLCVVTGKSVPQPATIHQCFSSLSYRRFVETEVH